MLIAFTVHEPSFLFALLELGRGLPGRSVSYRGHLVEIQHFLSPDLLDLSQSPFWGDQPVLDPNPFGHLPGICSSPARACTACSTRKCRSAGTGAEGPLSHRGGFPAKIDYRKKLVPVF